MEINQILGSEPVLCAHERQVAFAIKYKVKRAERENVLLVVVIVVDVIFFLLLQRGIIKGCMCRKHIFGQIVIEIKMKRTEA